jgi:hypothetical protein
MANINKAYDLYKEDEAGLPLWVETVIGMHHVKQRLMKFNSLKPGKYLIYDPTKTQFVEPSKYST